MDFFSNSDRTTELFSNKQEAFFALLVCAATVDGELDDFELDALNRITYHKSLFKNCEAESLFNIVFPILNDLGAEQVLIKAAAFLDEQEKKEVFVNTVDIYCANGTIEQSEKELLNEFAIVLELDKEWCQQVANTISMLYS